MLFGITLYASALLPINMLSYYSMVLRRRRFIARNRSDAICCCRKDNDIEKAVNENAGRGLYLRLAIGENTAVLTLDLTMYSSTGSAFVPPSGAA